MLELVIIVILSILLVYGAFVIIDQRKIINSLKHGIKITITKTFQDSLEEALKSVKPNGENHD